MPNNKNEKIIIYAAGWLGDNIMLHSLIIKLKEQRNAHITILNTQPHLAAVFSKMPEVDDIIEEYFPRKKLAFWQRYKLAKKIGAQGFSEIIVAPNNWKSGLTAYLSNIKKRTGWHGEARWLLLNNRHINITRLNSMATRYVMLANAPSNDIISLNDCPEPSLIPDDISLDILAKKLNLSYNSKASKIIALCPGAAYGKTKRWPQEHFASLATMLLAQGFQILLLGSKQEQKYGNHIDIITHNKCLNFIGKTSLSETIDIMGQTDLVVANDSGLMHMAAALKKPIIAIYGSTLPSFAPPLSKIAVSIWQEISCRPCKQRICPLHHYNCLKQITPRIVRDNIKNIFTTTS
tara:strand:+ start:6749 stop:7795 length:1047 start_codon:yes stop_codon:yes gene_type:complete